MSGLQEDLSSDDDFDHVRMPGTGTGALFSKDRDELHRAIAKMKEVPFGEEDLDFLSPIGSPAADSFSMGNHGRFQELKRKLEEDQANRLKTKNGAVSNSTDGSDVLNSLDVDSFLDILHPEVDTNDHSRMLSLSMRLDNHPKFTEMYRQIKERDHKILDLETRVNELDRQAVDLQDSISQRDKLISSKNEAVSMFQSKHRKELDQKEEELRKTQQTMFDLEKNLSGIQDRFNQENSRLTAELEAQRNKLEVLQANMEAAEAKADALQTKSEVLEAEISHLNTEREEFRNTIAERDEVLLTKDITIAELTESSTKLEATMKKLKMQFQAKLKTLKLELATKEKQVKELEDVELLKNQNAELLKQVTDLEEEKRRLEELNQEYSQGFQAELTNEVNRLKSENEEALEQVHQHYTEAVSKEELLTAELETLRLDNATVNSNNARMQEEYEVLEKRLENIVSELDTSKQNEDTLKQEISHMCNEKDALVSKLEKLEDELESLKWDHEENLEKCKQLTKEIQNLNVEKLRKIEDKDAGLKENMLMANELETVKLHNVTMSGDILRIEDEKHALEERIEELLNEREKSKLNNDVSSDALKEKELLTSKLEKLEDELESLKWEHEENLDMCNQLTKEIQNLNAEKQEFLRKIDDMEAVLKEKTLMANEFENFKLHNSTMSADIVRVQDEKHVLETRIEELQNELETAKLNDDISRDADADALKEKEVLTSKLEKLEDELESLKWDQEENLEKCKQLTKEIQNLNVEKQEFMRKIDDKDAVLKENVLIANELETFKLHNAALSGDIIRIQDEKLVLEKRIEELQNELETVKLSNDISRDVSKEKELLTSKLEKLQDELESLKWEHEENLEICNQLTKEIQNLNAEKQEFLRNIDDKEALLKEKTLMMNELETVKLHKETMSADIVRIQDEKHVLEKRIEELQNELETAKLNDDISMNVLKEKELLTSKLEKLEDELESLKWEHEENLDMCKQLTNEIQNLNAEKQEFLRNIDEKDAVLKEKTLMAYEFESFKLHNATMSADIVGIQDEKRVLEKRIEELQNGLETASLNAEIARDALKENELLLTSKLEKHEDELKSLKWEREENLEKCKQLTKEVQNLSNELETFKLHNTTMSGDIVRIQEEKHALEKQIEELQNQLETAKLNDGISRDALKEKELLLTSKLEKYEYELESLKWEREENLERCKQLTKEMQNLTNELETSKLHCATMSGEIARLQDEKHVLEKRIEELLNELESSKKLDDDISWDQDAVKEKELLASKLENVEDELESIKWEYEDMLESCKKFEKEIQKLQEEAESLRMEKQQLQQQLLEQPAVDKSESMPQPIIEDIMKAEIQKRSLLERKVELLQGKISEIELSEMKCFEETLLLKSWTRELEIDNQKKQSEIDLYKSLGSGDSRNIKATILQEEVMRLVNELQDRDRRCEGLTNEIIQLLEERDNLLKLTSVEDVATVPEAKTPTFKETLDSVPSYEDLQKKVGELEESIYAIKMDLKRERESRRLVQEQLFFSQSSHGYGSYTRNKSPVPTPVRTPSRGSVPVITQSPALLPSTPANAAFVTSVPTPLGSPALLKVDSPAFALADQFQTVELDNNGNGSGTQSPPSPMMRI